MNPNEPSGTGEPAASVLGQLGVLLLDAGFSVTDVRVALHRAAQSSGIVGLSYSVFPDLVIVSNARSGAGTVVLPRVAELTFRQAARANLLSQKLESGDVLLGDIPEHIAWIREMPRSHASLYWTLGSALVGGGLAVLFRCPWWAILSSIVVGASVGLVTTHLNRRSATASIVPFVSAFASTTVVGVLAELFGFGHVPLYAVCAPVAILVPGALITNALLELTAQDVVTGSARLSFGLIQLGFMIAGIAAGASITGLALDPGSAALVGQVARVSATNPGWQAIPPLWFSWIGVAILAAGVGLAFGSGRKLILVSVAVMTCTYAVLITLTPFTGSTFATGATAAVLFIGASALEQFLLAVPAPVSFQPAFLLLVPGTVGLVALTTFDTEALLSALKTFASLCIGIKVGAMLAEIALPSAGKNR
ncbi:MAG: threonine/serine exporter family protein [Mycobacterium sp.]